MDRRSLLCISLALVLCAALAPAASGATSVTTITVDSTADFASDGNSKTCASATPCTLRRAINQAYSLTSNLRPVTIRFNIPTSDSGYDPALETWKIQLDGTTLNPLRDLNGSVIISGATQPGGRSTGPKIIIDGQKNKNYGFVLRNNGNVVRGVAMQNFKTQHISVSSDGNSVQNNWFGLSDDGQFLSAGDGLTPEGGSGVVVSSGCDNNIIRGNRFAGFFATACSISGTQNVFAANFVGMRADGTVLLPGTFTKHPCLSGAWVGGVGISVAETGNQIGGPTVADRNWFAGLFLALSATSTQSPAIKVFSGKDHLIQNNFIGVDVAGKDIGVCGRGLDLGSGPKNLDVLNNTFAETGLSAILMNSSSLNGNTLQGNTFRRNSPWPGTQPGNNFAEDAIAYGPLVPAALRDFEPAAITSIAGNTVTGTSGDGSVCPECTVELFLEDLDLIKDCLKPLKRVTANASGNWTAILNTALLPNQGLRTMSTVPDSFTIIGLDPGSTSNISGLYQIPKVSVSASDATASEPGTNTGTFKFTRNVAYAPLTVYYTVSGTATAGVDYLALTGKVVFPEGVQTKTVQVVPKNDTIDEPDETVRVVLINKPNYNLAAPTQATVTIQDND